MLPASNRVESDLVSGWACTTFTAGPNLAIRCLNPRVMHSISLSPGEAPRTRGDDGYGQARVLPEHGRGLPGLRAAGCGRRGETSGEATGEIPVRVGSDDAMFALRFEPDSMVRER